MGLHIGGLWPDCEGHHQVGGEMIALHNNHNPCGGAASLAAEWGLRHFPLADQGRRLPRQSFVRQSFGNSALQNQPIKEK